MDAIYSQCLLDLPRLDLWINQIKDKDSPGSVFFRVIDSLGKGPGLKTLYNCTQGNLANDWKKGRTMFLKTSTQHLISSGRQIAKIELGDRPSLRIQKPFKIIHVPEDDPNEEPVELKELILSIEYDPVKDIAISRWNETDDDWILM